MQEPTRPRLIIGMASPVHLIVGLPSPGSIRCGTNRFHGVVCRRNRPLRGDHPARIHRCILCSVLNSEQWYVPRLDALQKPVQSVFDLCNLLLPQPDLHNPPLDSNPFYRIQIV